MPIQLAPIENNGAKIKVVGVGGGGGNIINSMANKGIEGVQFIAVNTDHQALDISKADIKIQIGKNLTRGLGTGMDMETGRKAVEEDREELTRALSGSDMVFITSGLGGGTGTGAAPDIAHIAKTQNALVVAIVTKPFGFEGKPRMKQADEGLKLLKEKVDSLIVIPNQRIIELIDEDCSKDEAFALANRVLYNATKGISQIITKPGEINVDFADVRTIMKNSGDALIGTGIAGGENRAEKCVKDALENPVLENVDITGARCVLVNISSNGSVKMSEIDKINEMIHEAVGDNSKYIFGIVNDKEMDDSLMVTVIATGFNKAEEEFRTGDEEADEVRSTGTMGRITRLPDTQKELEELDVPAWKRRQKDIINSVQVPDDLGETSKQKKKESFDDIFSDIDINEKDTTPAFLRRQMD